ncbi:MAG: hypothetical protein RBJ76_04360 [Stenomitos frigidus ULC029]
MPEVQLQVLWLWQQFRLANKPFWRLEKIFSSAIAPTSSEPAYVDQ